ncbi:MAG: hypothetical protein P8X58_13355 [Syntrophobacterales bacterium]
MSLHPLNNGLTLEFWDYSRPIAGDRWFVLLEVRIAIPTRSPVVRCFLDLWRLVSIYGSSLQFFQEG